MYNFLTGIKSTGRPHLGNVIGVIYPTIFLTKNEKFKTKLILIANLHSITNLKYIKNNKKNAYKILAVWLACGIDSNQFIFYRQSDIPEVTELLWFFSLIYPYNRLKLVHSFKENVKQKKKIINTGILTYPILMAADILISKAELVLVGKDQLQHLEIARKIAKKINNIKKIFTLPQAIVIENLIPGTDGTKMSKTKNNIIDLFASKKEIKKQIMKIKTKKNFSTNKKELLKDNLYNIYTRLAGKENTEKIKNNFKIGYEHAKEELYRFIINKFKRERILYKYYINRKNKLDTIFKKGAKQMKKIVNYTLSKVRNIFECN